MKLEIVLAKDEKEAKSYLDKGYCPVECSFGDKSIVDKLNLDHHGEWSKAGPVAGCYGLHGYYGARKDDPRFVVTRTPDPDAIFAILTVAGMISPTKWGPLCDLICLIDMEPIGVNIMKFCPDQGSIFLYLRTLLKPVATSENWMECVWLWKYMLGYLENLFFSERFQPFLDAAIESETSRIVQGNMDYEERAYPHTSEFLIIENPKSWAFDCWYKRIPRNLFNHPTGWKHPVVIAAHKKYTIGCPTIEVAEAMFGPGGLKNVFEKLGPGWGGRESIGRSPKGLEVTKEKTKEIRDLIMEISEKYNE